MEKYQSTDITELAKAMLKVQAEVQPALKDRENTFARSKYATLNSVMDACRDSLIRNGIWLVQHPVPVEEGHLGLVTKIIHTQSGQWQSSLMVMPLPKADPQGYGSALTYGRRYALSTLVGIVTEEDDDGIRASFGSQNTRTVKPSPQNDDFGHPALAGLPHIDGITFSTTETQDHKLCIVATGDTRAKKQILAQAGFRWNPERKFWWRYADAA